MSDPVQLDATTWEVPASARADMRVPARVFADGELIEPIVADGALEQLCNVATLPGIAEAALAMPDAHQGYGFPVGGVAATEPPDGVVSPGGVGYDINCGVRLLVLPVDVSELGHERRVALVHELSRAVPAGAGTDDDVRRSESEGRMEAADPAEVSQRARQRGDGQLGTLGSGNHFLELQRVGRVLERPAAVAYGLTEGGLTVLIHSGSRGLGHQVCTDFVRRLDAADDRYGIMLPDWQLACAPVDSPDGRAYLAAMAAAANFAWANRQAIAHRVRQAVAHVLGDAVADGTRQVYDVAHNVAKLERHGDRQMCVHRKGVTRAFPPGHDEVPEPYRDVGQPVFIPGSMGTSSFVLSGRPGAMERSFGTVCHGAGRRLSRRAARERVGGKQLREELERAGIAVRSASARGLAEEAPFAYKDVAQVVDVVERAGLAAPVAELLPIGVVKG